MKRSTKLFLNKMIIPTVILIWATVYFIEVSGYKELNSVLIRPVYILLAIFYVINAISDFRAAKVQANVDAEIPGKDFSPVDIEKSAAFEGIASEKKPQWNPQTIRTVSIYALIFIYAVLLKSIGFLIMTPLFIFGCLFTVGERKVLKLFLIPLIATIVIYLIFFIGLKILLPAGILSAVGL